MIDVVELLILGTLTSALYALLAIGFTLVYAIAGIENLTHGTYVMVGAYGMYLVTEFVGHSPVLQVVAAVGVGVAAGVLTWKGLVEHIIDNPVAVFMVTLLVAIAAEQSFIAIFSADPKLFPGVVSGSIRVAGTTVPWNLIAAFVVSWACLFGLIVLIKRTHVGRSIIAVAQNRRSAELSGVNTDRVYLLVWIISGAFAGLVGVFYGSYATVEPHMWVFPLIYSFSIVIVGGLGSLTGTVVAAHIIGFAEIATIQIDPRFRGVSALVILILIMLVKPTGLFGREELE